MTELFIKQKVFSWGDKFFIYNSAGEILYSVIGEVFTIGKKLHIYDQNENEIAYIHQKAFSLKPKYFISRFGDDVAEVVKEFTFLKPRYTVEAFNWSVQGNFSNHDFTITKFDEPIAQISQKWFSWGDTYKIEVKPGEDAINVLCTVLIIDAVKASQAAAAASNNG